jgi:hypothetical protein
MTPPRKLGFLSKVYEFFFANLSLRLVALLFSLGFYVFVHGPGEAQRDVWVDVVTLLPTDSTGKVLVSEFPERVKVVVTGRSSVLSSLSREPLPPLQIDLRDTTRRAVAMERALVEVPAGVNVLQITPSMVELRWENRIEKRVPVRAQVLGSVRQGLELNGVPRVTPDSVVLRGPESELERIQHVSTEPVDLSAFGVGTLNRSLALTRTGRHVTSGGVESVLLEFEIVPHLEERVLRRLDLAVVGGTVKGAPRPARVDVRLRGLPTVIEGIDPDHVLPTVNVAELAIGAGPSFRRVEVRGLPEGVQISRIVPGEVLVERIDPAAPTPARGRR